MTKNTGNLSPEFALLGFLYQSPDHGYDLHQKLIRELGHVWHLSQSQAYAILKRLEERGYIAARPVSQQKLPAKQILKITAEGRRQFRKWLSSPSNAKARVIRMEFLTRLYFAALYMPENIDTLFDAQATEITASLFRLNELLESLPDEELFNRMSLVLRLRQLELIQDWLTEIRSKIQNLSEATP